jgi:hypothetical protein
MGHQTASSRSRCGPRRALGAGLLLALGALVAVVASGYRDPQAPATFPAPPLTSSASTRPGPPPPPAAAPEPTLAPSEALEPPPEAPPPDASTLAPLTPAAQADPEAVAERFLVTYASFDPAADPRGLDARLAKLATPALAQELSRGSSASAALDDLRRRNVAFVGQVVDLSVSERSDTRAVVLAVVEHTTVINDVAQPDFRLVPYTLTLVPAGAGWVVAGLAQ